MRKEEIPKTIKSLINEITFIFSHQEEEEHGLASTGFSISQAITQTPKSKLFAIIASISNCL